MVMTESDDVNELIVDLTARGDAYQALAEELLDGDPGMLYWPDDGEPTFTSGDVARFIRRATERGVD